MKKKFDWRNQTNFPSREDIGNAIKEVYGKEKVGEEKEAKIKIEEIKQTRYAPQNYRPKEAQILLSKIQNKNNDYTWFPSASSEVTLNDILLHCLENEKEARKVYCKLEGEQVEKNFEFCEIDTKFLREFGMNLHQINLVGRMCLYTKLYRMIDSEEFVVRTKDKQEGKQEGKQESKKYMKNDTQRLENKIDKILLILAEDKCLINSHL